MEPRKGLAAVFDRPAPTGRQLLLGGGHLAALWALAFVQPLLDLLGNNPDFFVARGNSTGDILILAIGFTLLPPLVLFGIGGWSARSTPGLTRPASDPDGADRHLLLPPGFRCLHGPVDHHPGRVTGPQGAPRLDGLPLHLRQEPTVDI